MKKKLTKDAQKLTKKLQEDFEADVEKEQQKQKKKQVKDVRKFKNRNFKLDINPDMLMVKDFYWGLKMEDIDISPKQAAMKCGVKPKSVDEWFMNSEINDWFFDPPLKMRPQLKAVCMMAMRRGMEMLQKDDDRAEKVMRYFIDQVTGKAKQKGMGVGLEDDDDGIEEDIKQLEKTMKKYEEITGANNEAIAHSNSAEDWTLDNNNSIGANGDDRTGG